MRTASLSKNFCKYTEVPMLIVTFSVLCCVMLSLIFQHHARKNTQKSKKFLEKNGHSFPLNEENDSSDQGSFQNWGLRFTGGDSNPKRGGEDPVKSQKTKTLGFPHFTGGSFPDFTSCRPPGGRGSGPQPYLLEYKALQWHWAIRIFRIELQENR